MISTPAHIVVLSPHRDDAAFSCGLLLWQAAQAEVAVTIVNVFTRSRYAPYLHENSTEAVTAARLAEDTALLQALPGKSVRLFDLDELDAPLRRRIPDEQVLECPLDDAFFGADVRQLHRQFLALPPCDLVLAPKALGGHLDHAVVHQAACHTVDYDYLGFYEDLPYAARMPEPPKASCVLTSPEAGAIKEHLASLYPSQVAQEVAREIGGYAASVGGERYWLPEKVRLPW